MKKFLYILFIFVSCNIATYEYSYAQVSIGSWTGNSYGSSSTSYLLNTITYTTSEHYLVHIVNTRTAGTPDVPSISHADFTVTQIQTLTDGSRRITLFLLKANTSSSANIAATFTNSQDYFREFHAKISNVDVAGVIPQSNTATGATANPTVTLSALTNSYSAVIMTAINDRNPFGGTAEGNERQDAGTALSTVTGSYVMEGTDNTPTITSAAANWLAIAVEIKGLRTRRIISSN